MTKIYYKLSYPQHLKNIGKGAETFEFRSQSTKSNLEKIYKREAKVYKRFKKAMGGLMLRLRKQSKAQFLVIDKTVFALVEKKTT